MSYRWMLYGANGYTGELIARKAFDRGDHPILAGRNGEKICQLADELGAESRIFPLESPSEIASQLGGISAVLNCAGPFSSTAAPLIEACLTAGVHYLDITGEIDVIEHAARLNDRAAALSVVLMPAVGFDVVPSDCLAAAVANAVGRPKSLQLAFGGMSRISPGTAKTLIENLPRGGRARIGGRIERVPTAWRSMEVPFREGPAWAVTIPWGDVASAYYSTGAANIEVYTRIPQSQIAWMRRLRFLLPITAFGPLRSALTKLVLRRTAGPTEDERSSGEASLWGCATGEDGDVAEGTLVTPEGYQLTVLTSLECLNRLQVGNYSGFLTPSLAFGSGLITQIPGCDLKVTKK